MQFYSTTQDAGSLLQGSIVLLPAVTTGNVGQLAVDVCISSMMNNPQGQASAVTLIGRLETDTVLPVVGADAYTMQQPGTLATALELFHVVGTRVVLLQQRAPARKGCQQEFAKQLASWLKSQGVTTCVVLAGLPAGTLLKQEQQLMGSRIRYMAGKSGSDDVCAGLGWQLLEEEVVKEEQEVHNLLPPWPFINAASGSALHTLLLAMFVSEGDNQQDGVQLAGSTMQWLHASSLLTSSPAATLLGLEPTTQEGRINLKLQTPCSWAAVYGHSLMSPA